MRSDSLLKQLGVASTLVVVVALGATSTGATAAQSSAKIKNCTVANNVEAIIDDSGSMSGQDPSKFRTSLLSAFANIGSNNGLIFGGIEFGTSPNVLFGPATIPGVIPAMQASFAQIDANNAGTDYQEAFAAATAHNGTANARLFLTDGNPSSYPTNHLSPKVKTYVIGIGDFAASAGGNAVLTQLASETGGPAPFLISDSSQVQPVAGAIAAAIKCKKPPLTFTNLFNRQGEQVTYAFKPDGKSADVLISWGNATTALDALGFSLAGGGAKGAVASVAKARGIKARKKKGATFVTVRLKGLKKGKKVKFKVKAKQLVVDTVGTTQVIR